MESSDSYCFKSYIFSSFLGRVKYPGPDVNPNSDSYEMFSNTLPSWLQMKYVLHNFYDVKCVNSSSHTQTMKTWSGKIPGLAVITTKIFDCRYP